MSELEYKLEKHQDQQCPGQMKPSGGSVLQLEIKSSFTQGKLLKDSGVVLPEGQRMTWL